MQLDANLSKLGLDSALLTKSHEHAMNAPPATRGLATPLIK
jgi:hypothetical protein